MHYPYTCALKKGNKIFPTKVGYHIKYGKERAEWKEDTERIDFFVGAERTQKGGISGFLEGERGRDFFSGGAERSTQEGSHLNA